MKKFQGKCMEILDYKRELEELSQKLLESQEKIYHLEQFKKTVEEASIFSITDADGIITEVNRNFEEISGYRREELLGSPHNLVRHEDMPKEVFKEMWKTIKAGKIWRGMVKNKRKDGRAYYVISEITPIYNLDGSFKEYIGIRTDVTELEEYKNLLRHELDSKSENLEDNLYYTSQYEDAINSITAVIKTDTDNTITYVNKKFCDLSGYTLHELIGKNCSDLRHHKHRDSKLCEQIAQRLSQRFTANHILSNIAKDGSEYITNTLFYPMLRRDGEVVEYLQIMHDVTEIFTLNEEIINTQKEVVLTMGAIGETRSQETGLHVKRVAEYSYLLAKLVGLSENEASLLKQASPMHDIGKVGIPDSILNKPGKLTSEEFETMKSHAMIGYEMLKHSKRPILRASAQVALTHHEKYDGSGYPQGLRAEDIPIYGRITAIADVFDALGHDRCYKKAWELERILDLFKQESGKHFDPNLIDLFFENLDSFLSIRDNFQD
jgi:PAS domain S-box-containing protein